MNDLSRQLKRKFLKDRK